MKPMKRMPILIVILALALPAAAQARGSSTCQAYNPQLCSVSSNHSSSAGSGATLPFTGLDLMLLAGGGAILIGAGVIVRRLTTSLDPARRAAAQAESDLRSDPLLRHA
jgi:hypothetical protein